MTTADEALFISELIYKMECEMWPEQSDSFQFDAFIKPLNY